MAELTRQGIKSIIKILKNQEEPTNKDFLLQIVGLSIYADEEMKDSVKAIIELSDGCSWLKCKVGKDTIGAMDS